VHTWYRNGYQTGIASDPYQAVLVEVTLSQVIWTGRSYIVSSHMDVVWSLHSIHHIMYHVCVLVLGGSLIF
jgi:hypothetical protein